MYSEASIVIAWIGGEYEDSKEAFSLMCEFLAASKKGEDALQIFFSSLELPERQEEPSRMALLRLLDRPWFKRIWIIQEIVLAKDILVSCGESYCSWDILYAFNKLLVQHSLAEYFGIASQRLASIGTIQNAFPRFKDGLDLGYLLVQTKHFRSTIPHDRIYGLAALLSKEDLDNLVVDYEQPVATFYNKVVLNHIKLHQNFDLLFKGGYSSQKSRLNMPTWCGDWSLDTSADDILPLCLHTYDNHHPFNCNGITEPETSVGESGQVLIVADHKFDIITELQIGTSPDFIPNGLYDAALGSSMQTIFGKRVWAKVEQFKVLAQKSIPYPDELDFSSVWPRLLVWDQGPAIDMRSESYERYFHLGNRVNELQWGACEGDTSLSDQLKPNLMIN